MKLNKKTIYRVKTQELFDKMMEDAKKQDYSYLHTDIWTMYKENTGVRIDEKGNMNYCSMSYYWDNKQTDYKDYYYTEYRDIPEIYPLNFGCVGIDAPDFKTAYEAFRKHMLNIFGDKSETNTYTVRVDDNKTTVITPDGKCATAKCHPDDDFDIIEGFKTAIEKIREMDRKLTFEEKKILSALELLNCSTFEVTDYEQINGYNNNGNDVEIDITDKDVFSWLNTHKELNVKEILEKYA